MCIVGFDGSVACVVVILRLEHRQQRRQLRLLVRQFRRPPRGQKLFVKDVVLSKVNAK